MGSAVVPLMGGTTVLMGGTVVPLMGGTTVLMGGASWVVQ